MGSESSTQRERIERGSSTSVLTLSGMDISSWSELSKKLAKTENICSMTLSDNRLRRAIPPVFVQLPLWATLTSLDISGNSLRCACALGYDPDSKRHCGRLVLEGNTSSVSDNSAPPLSAPINRAVRLEVLNLSRNRFEQLPVGLCRRFPTLRKLICRGNATPLSLPGGLVRCLGESTALASVDFSDCGLRSFLLVDDSTAPASPTAPLPTTPDGGDTVVVYPALQEVLLEGCSFSGLFTLVKTDPTRVNTARFRFPKLKRISIAAPKQADTLEAIDPIIYTNAPELNSLDFKGASNEKTIRERLAASSPYQVWQRRHKEVIDKQLQGAGTANLME